MSSGSIELISFTSMAFRFGDNDAPNSRYRLRRALIAPKYFLSGHCTARPMIDVPCEYQSNPLAVECSSYLEHCTNVLSSLDGVIHHCASKCTCRFARRLIHPLTF